MPFRSPLRPGGRGFSPTRLATVALVALALVASAGASRSASGTVLLSDREQHEVLGALCCCLPTDTNCIAGVGACPTVTPAPCPATTACPIGTLLCAISYCDDATTNNVCSKPFIGIGFACAVTPARSCRSSICGCSRIGACNLPATGSGPNPGKCGTTTACKN